MNSEHNFFDDDQRGSPAISYFIEPMSRKTKGNNPYGNAGTHKCEQCRRTKGKGRCNKCTDGSCQSNDSPKLVDTVVPNAVKYVSGVGDAKAEKSQEFLQLRDVEIFNQCLHNLSSNPFDFCPLTVRILPNR